MRASWQIRCGNEFDLPRAVSRLLGTSGDSEPLSILSFASKVWATTRWIRCAIPKNMHITLGRNDIGVDTRPSYPNGATCVISRLGTVVLTIGYQINKPQLASGESLADATFFHILGYLA